MAGRPPKEGIDYSGWDVHIFDDPKIDKLMDAQGCAGFTVYFFLCQRVYGSNGYYYSWSYDDAATTARKIGGGVGSETVINTVNLCFRIGLFDKNLYDRYKIITSRGIQKRFCQVGKSRAANRIIRDYWLLNEQESAGLNFYTLNLNYGQPKLNYDPSKLNYAPLKERIVKDSIVNTAAAARAHAGQGSCNENQNPTAEAEKTVTLYYLDHIQPDAHGTVIDKLCSWLDLLPPEVIVMAIDRAVMNNHRSYNYVEGVLRGWVKDGLTTVSLVEGHLRDWNNRKRGRNDGNRKNTRATGGHTGAGDTAAAGTKPRYGRVIE